jgi:hypothetical protein
VEYVGRVTSVSTSDGEVRVGLTVRQVISPAGARIGPAETVWFSVPEERMWETFMAADPQIMLLLWRTIRIPVIGLDPDAVDLDRERIIGKSLRQWFEMRDQGTWPRSLVGEQVRVIYHEAYSSQYQGRLSVWWWTGSLDDAGLEFLAHLHHVQVASEFAWHVGVKVTRVLSDRQHVLRAGDVVEFVWYDSMFLEHGLTEIYPGMEADLEHEFKVVYFEPFDTPYQGFKVLSPW